jgi:outer membrane protein TolC
MFLAVLSLGQPALGANPAPAETVGLTTIEALARARKHSPVLDAAVIERERARLVESEAHRYVPSLTANLGYTRSAAPSLQASGTVIGVGDGLSLDVGITQQFSMGTTVSSTITLGADRRQFTQPQLAEPITLGPGYGLGLRLEVAQPLLRGLGDDYGEAGLRLARSAQTAAASAREQTASGVARDVLAAYWALWYAQEAVAIERRGLEVVRRQLGEAEQRLAVGDLAPLDLLPLQIEVASIAEAVLTAQSVLARKRVALAGQLGIKQLADASLAVDSTPPPTPSAALPLVQALSAASERSYALHGLQQAVDQARIQAALAAEQTRPELNALVWADISGLGNDAPGAALEMFAGFEAVSVFAGLSLALPLDDTRTRSDAARARLAVRGAQARLRTAAEALGVQVADTHITHSAARDRLILAQATAQLATQSVEGQRARFEAGAATALELVVATQQRRQAERRVAQARADIAVADVVLRHQMGSLIGGLVVAPELGRGPGAPAEAIAAQF